MNERIRQIRAHFHLTQRELAEKIGVSTGFISLVETGRSGLSGENIENLCKTLHVSAAWVIDGTGTMESEDPAEWIPERETEEERRNHAEAIAGRIQELRQTLRLTQKQFATGMGASREIVALVEQRRNIASEGLLKKIEKGYGVRQEWLRDGQGEIFIGAESVNKEEAEGKEEKTQGKSDEPVEKPEALNLYELVYGESQYIVKMKALLDECDEEEKKDLLAMAELYVKAIKRHTGAR